MNNAIKFIILQGLLSSISIINMDNNNNNDLNQINLNFNNEQSTKNNNGTVNKTAYIAKTCRNGHTIKKIVGNIKNIIIFTTEGDIQLWNSITGKLVKRLLISNASTINLFKKEKLIACNDFITPNKIRIYNLFSGKTLTENKLKNTHLPNNNIIDTENDARFNYIHAYNINIYSKFFNWNNIFPYKKKKINILNYNPNLQLFIMENIKKKTVTISSLNDIINENFEIILIPIINLKQISPILCAKTFGQYGDKNIINHRQQNRIIQYRNSLPHNKNNVMNDKDYKLIGSHEIVVLIGKNGKIHIYDSTNSKYQLLANFQFPNKKDDFMEEYQSGFIFYKNKPLCKNKLLFLYHSTYEQILEINTKEINTKEINTKEIKTIKVPNNIASYNNLTMMNKNLIIGLSNAHPDAPDPLHRTFKILKFKKILPPNQCNEKKEISKESSKSNCCTVF